MNVQVPPHFEDIINEKIASGRYNNPSEVVGEALRLMEDFEQARQTELNELRQAIEDGINSGPSTAWDVEEVKARGRALYEAYQQKIKAKAS